MARSLLLALALACANAGTALASPAPDRALDGFEDSGYFFPKNLVRHGIRSSPGSLWLFFAVYLLCCYEMFLLPVCFSIVFGLKRLFRWCFDDGATGPALAESERLVGVVVQDPLVSAWMNAAAAPVTTLLSVGVLFVGLSATRLSEAAEAYLVAMVSVQLMLHVASSPWGEQGVTCLQLGAMFGIAMLDSYLPLNQLNVAYFAAAVLMRLAAYCRLCLQSLPRIRLFLYPFFSCLQMGFSIAAFVVARGVEGTHSGPMLALLCTACVCTAFALLHWLRVAMVDLRPQYEPAPAHAPESA